jgi:hypothetical protein
MKVPTTPDTAYEYVGESADDCPSLVPSDLQVPNFFSFTPPATIMIPRRVSVVEPESQPPESSIVLHARRKYPNSSPKLQSPMKEPATTDTAYEFLGDSPSLVPSDLQVPNFFSFTPPATIMIPRRVSVVESESQPPESSIVLHARRKYPNSSPKKKSRMKEPATPDTACESLGDSPSLVTSGIQIPNFFSFTPQATVMIRRRVSIVEPESQPPENSIVLHARRKYPNSSPKKKSRMKEPATPDTACESLGDSPSLVPAGNQAPNFFSFTPPATVMIPRRVSVVEPKSQPPDSSKIHVKEEPKPKPAREERRYWNKIADGRLGHFGILNLRTAEALMQLGSSHMRCEVSNPSWLMYPECL